MQSDIMAESKKNCKPWNTSYREHTVLIYETSEDSATVMPAKSIKIRVKEKCVVKQMVSHINNFKVFFSNSTL